MRRATCNVQCTMCARCALCAVRCATLTWRRGGVPDQGALLGEEAQGGEQRLHHSLSARPLATELVVSCRLAEVVCPTSHLSRC
eukprot:784927-Rhodomonas_salina.1